MAASIVLFARRRWWVTLLIIAFWTGALTMNGGGLSLVFSEEEGFRVRLSDNTGGTVGKGATRDRFISAEDLDVIYAQRGTIGLLAIGLLASGYVAFIRVMRSEVRQRARLETEMKIAQEIQKALLPDNNVDHGWYSTAGVAVPATEVGGDFYDVVALRDDAVAVAIADVTGHGVGSGILSAMTKSALRSQLEHDAEPSAVLTNLNSTLYELTNEKMFVTLAFAVVDRESRTLRLATAGHPPAFLLRASGAIEELRTPNLALGVRPETAFSHLTRTVGAGDLLLLYTDGVVEASSPGGEQFGPERLSAAAKGASSREVCDAVLEALRRYTGGDQFQDDVSLVCVRFT
jgi:serine phosphatase RsbU (regulator of sigma subunit)